MAAMASLAPTAVSSVQGTVAVLQNKGLNGLNGGGEGGGLSGVQLRRNSDFAGCKVVVKGRGRRERKVVELGGAIRGFSGPGVGDGSVVEGLPGSQEVPNLSVRSHAVEMKKGYGAFGGGGATLEKSKLDLSQSTARVKQEVGFVVLVMNVRSLLGLW